MCAFPMCVSIMMLLVYIMCFFFYILLGHLLAKRIGTFTIQKYLHIHVYENKISEQMQLFINIRKTELKSLENLGFPFCISSNISPKYCFTLSSSVILHKKSHAFFLPASHKALAGIRAALMEGSSLHIQANSLHNYKTIQQQLKRVNISLCMRYQLQ